MLRVGLAALFGAASTYLVINGTPLQPLLTLCPRYTNEKTLTIPVHTDKEEFWMLVDRGKYYDTAQLLTYHGNRISLGSRDRDPNYPSTAFPPNSRLYCWASRIKLRNAEKTATLRDGTELWRGLAPTKTQGRSEFAK